MNNKSSIPARRDNKLKGTPLPLLGYQLIDFIDKSTCPHCKKPDVFYRSWREDYLCGGCKKVYELIDGKVCYLGNQEDLD